MCIWLHTPDNRENIVVKSGGEGGGRGWDSWMVWSTQWTWVWANSRRQWKTGKPGVLESKVLQRVGHGWVTEQQGKQTHSHHKLPPTHTHNQHRAIQLGRNPKCPASPWEVMELSPTFSAPNFTTTTQGTVPQINWLWKHWDFHSQSHRSIVNKESVIEHANTHGGYPRRA